MIKLYMALNNNTMSFVYFGGEDGWYHNRGHIDMQVIRHFVGRDRMTWWDGDDVREVDVLTGCFMLVRREAMEQVGPMDEQFFMYFEETDWCYRFKNSGWKVMFTPNAEIIHLGGASSKKVRKGMVNQWRKSMLLYYRKHKGLLAYVSAWILITLFFLTRVPYWRFKAIAARPSAEQ